MPPIGVTCVTSLAIEGITAHLAMLFIHSRFFMVVAIDAREVLEVAGEMAIGTRRVAVWSAVDGECVVELCLCPCDVSREMTRFAGCWEPGRGMVRVSRSVIVTRVATVAISGQVVSLTVADLTIEGAVCTL